MSDTKYHKLEPPPLNNLYMHVAVATGYSISGTT